MDVRFGYTVGRDHLPILDHLNLDLRVGTVTALLGPSGGGKTTILNLAAGLLRPEAGSVRVLGLDPARALGSLPLAYSLVSNPLLPSLSVLRNAALPLVLRGLPDALDRARQALNEVGLARAEHLMPHQLSAGMRVRVSIAASLALDPEIYLLDEPHAALDAMTRKTISRVIRDGVETLRARRPVTILLATHAESEALEISDKCIVLNRGRPARLVGTVEVPRRALAAPCTEMTGVGGRLHELLEEASLPDAVVVSGNPGASMDRADGASWRTSVQDLVLRTARVMWPWVAFIGTVLSVWLVATTVLRAPEYLLPTPARVGAYLVEHSRALTADASHTGFEALLGLAVAAGVAAIIGALSDRLPALDKMIWPVLVSSQVVPLLAIAPFMHIWLPGLPGIVTMTAIVCFFPLAVAFRSGLRQAMPDEEALFVLHSQSWWDTFWMLRVPRSMPTTMAGLSAAAPIAVVGSILAGLAGADEGLGRNFLLAARRINTELLFSSLILATALGLLFYGGAVLIHHLVVPSYLRYKSSLSGAQS